MRGRMHGEKNDLAMLAKAEVELLDSKDKFDAVKAKLECAEKTIAQMYDEKLEADRKVTVLQSKLLDAKEMFDQLKEEKASIEKSASSLQEELSSTKEVVSRLEDEKINAEREMKLELNALHSQHQLEKIEMKKMQDDFMKELKEHYQDDRKVLKQENRALSSLWEVDRRDVEIISNDPIGSGGWGTIHKGKFKGIHVAIKKLYPHILSEHNEGIVRREISMLAQVRHPNILLFLGAVISNFKINGESSLLITELLDTDLRFAYEQGQVQEESKVPILCDVASALVYLHTSSVPIIHRDVSSANILLQAVYGERRWKAKLSDFGSANVISKSITPNAGAAIYAAPEILSAYKQPQTEKVDVYSFGVLICEVVLCSPPPDKREDYFTLMLSKIYHKQELYQLAKQCTKLSCQDRPCMPAVLTILSSLIH